MSEEQPKYAVGDYVHFRSCLYKIELISMDDKYQHGYLLRGSGSCENNAGYVSIQKGNEYFRKA